MDAIKYFEESDRMCKTYPTCKGCPLDTKYEYSCIKDSVKAVPIVEKWAEEHPQKTILMDFLEKFPKAKLGEDGTPYYCCPRDLGYKDETHCRDCDCISCWNRPLE